MKKKVHALIVSNNLVGLYTGDDAHPLYALHGDVPGILEKNNLELVSVWQTSEAGGVEGCWKDRFFVWPTPPLGFNEMISKFYTLKETLNKNQKLRHYTGIKIYSYGDGAEFHTLVMNDAIMNKFRMFLDGSWMVSPHIPTSVPRIIESLKEFSLLTGEETYADSVYRLTKGNAEDIRDLLHHNGPLTHDLALRLAAVTGMRPDWWINKDYEYRNAVFENDLDRQIKMLALSKGRLV